MAWASCPCHEADAGREKHQGEFMNRREFLKAVPAAVAVGWGGAARAAKQGGTRRPNVVWIVSEDMGADLGCWGVKVHTPRLDGLAAEGMRFTRVFGTASVCMPNRTAMATGVTQTTLGSVTMRPPEKFRRPLPPGVLPLPAVLRGLGYFCGNITDRAGIGSRAKDDWNFRLEGKPWDTHKLADLKARQPFYAQFNFPMAHRPFRRDAARPVNPATVNLPPCYPDHPVNRRSWADYLESVQHLDRGVGRVLDWLRREGLAGSTIVFFLSDHGEAFLRGKYFLYDRSLNQPLIVHWPRACRPPADFRPGAASGRLIAGVDLPAQTVACAGGTVPTWMHGRAFLGPQARPREEVFSAADHIGGSKLKSRSVRTARYKYIRNYNTSLSVRSASTEYRKACHPMYPLLEILAERGELKPLHRTLLLDRLPPEELYDLAADPHELHNLAAEPAHAERKRDLRRRLEQRVRTSGDLGFEPLDPEHAAFFDTYRRTQRRKLRGKQEQLAATVRRAVEQAAAAAASGKAKRP